MRLKRFYHSFLLIYIFFTSGITKSQVNCNIFGSSDCKEACELSNLAEPYQGRWESQKAFDKAIRLCPNFDYAYREKSVPYLKRGDFITWKIFIDKSVELNPKENLGYRGWCQYQFLRNYPAAIKDIEELEKLVGEDNIGFSQNGNYDLHIVKALCYKGIGNKEKAIAIIEKQLSKKKYTPFMFDYYHLGVLYYETNKYDKAVEYFEKQIKNNDYFAEPYYYLALISKKQKEKVKAQNLIKRALDYYSKGRKMIDPYTHVMDKVYEGDMKVLQKDLEF